jgi:hypothetical protein
MFPRAATMTFAVAGLCAINANLLIAGAQDFSGYDSRGACLQACYRKYQAPRPDRYLPGRVDQNAYLECVRRCERAFEGDEDTTGQDLWETF